MRIDILTLFPETVGDVLSESILGRAQERGFIRIETHQIRDYTANKQNQVDDYPYGGGRGADLISTTGEMQDIVEPAGKEGSPKSVADLRERAGAVSNRYRTVRIGIPNGCG